MSLLLVTPQDVMTDVNGCVLAYYQLYLSLVLASNITCLITNLKIQNAGMHRVHYLLMAPHHI
jgi:hypothetical protein